MTAGLSLETARRDDERSFWLGMAMGWGAYLVINLLMITLYEQVAFGTAVGVAAANVVPPALVSVPIAVQRQRLLRPEWSLLRTVAVHLVVGVIFALGTSVLAWGVVQSFDGLRSIAEESPQFGVGFLFTSALFLYVIFFGFLMWSESVRRVQESHRALAREAVLRAEAEARAIRAQFNPHFVFNTLHSLMLLVRADPDMAERAIEDVAALIRYASIVQRKDLDVVPLSKELAIARKYVDLETLRLQQRLRVEWAVAVAPEDVTIPAFALQTLVENAIKHGIEPEPKGGHVHVEIRSAAGVLELTVADDGSGAREAEVEGAAGRGLDLLRGRLETRYGEAGDLRWTTTPGEGFRVEVRLPLEAPAPVPALDLIEERVRPGATGA